MPSKRGTLFAGFLGLMSVFGIPAIYHETKPYMYGEYYSSDNQTMLDYRTIWLEQNATVPEGYEVSFTPPAFEGIPIAISNPVALGSRYSFFQDEVDFTDALHVSEYQFKFEYPVKIYVPFDCSVTNVSPNTASGVIPGFAGYFTGRGVTVEAVGLITDTSLDLGAEYEVKITFSNLGRIWQSIGHDVSCRDSRNNRELYYTNFLLGADYRFNPGQFIGISGRTGSIPADEIYTDYVTIRLETREKNTQTWTGLTFAEFFRLSSN